MDKASNLAEVMQSQHVPTLGAGTLGAPAGWMSGMAASQPAGGSGSGLSKTRIQEDHAGFGDYLICGALGGRVQVGVTPS